MNFFRNKTTRVLILAMCALAFIGITISRFYYKNLNNSIDPRIVGARTLYEKYNGYAQNNEFDSIFYLMDTIESIYANSKHYKDSYETGVLYNNRAASFLIMAFNVDTFDRTVQDSLIFLAEKSAEQSVEIYTRWLNVFRNKNEEEIKDIISPDFYSGLENFSPDQKKRYLKNRIKELMDSRIETERRLSVSYTNLGIICRHKLEYESAANYYTRAIELWDRNLTAENNLNILLNRPLKKRNFIQKLFPPDRDKN
ncbi:MAG: hypothetical protein JXJ22_03040 [Bacteroidales bacterium]|nr:hypothetical protein [Bacteroidales bacterium]